jgi:hypothetical protein
MPLGDNLLPAICAALLAAIWLVSAVVATGTVIVALALP